MPYENKGVKDGNHPSRTVAHDHFFTEPDKQAAPAPFFTKKDTDKEDAPVQGPFIQPKAKAAEPAAKTHSASPPKANDTGLPDDLKAGMEDLSGFSLDGVNVHYNSDRPAQLQAYAYTQGKEIHVGPGQEKHLPHEAWHVVQQQQGRVNATMQMKGVGINNDEGLEREADVMGKRAMQRGAVADGGDEGPRRNVALTSAGAPVQRLTGFEVETKIPVYHDTEEGDAQVKSDYVKGFTPAIRNFLFGGLKYGAVYGGEPEGHFTLTADHNELQQPHSKLIQLLSLTGFLRPEIRQRSIANLEYITPPRDELGAGSRQLFQEDITHVTTHVNNTLGLARGWKEAPVPFTRNWILTGIPREEILKWVTIHKADPSLFEPVLNEMQALITNQLYVQQTTGVLPEDIPALYSSASEKMKTDKVTPARFMSDFMTAAVEIAQKLYGTALPEELPAPFKKYKGAVIGYLTYLASHLLADTLSLTKFMKTNVTAKNFFPYFPKVSLSTSFKALPEELRNEKEAWKAFLEQLCEDCGAYGLKYWEREGLPINRDVMKSKIFQEWNPYYGKPPEEDNNEQPGTTSAANAFDKLIEGKDVSIGVQKNLPGLDKPHDLVTGATGQQAIPVEDRLWNSKFREEITTDSIGKAFMSAANAAIARQLGHVPESERENIEKGIEDKPDYNKMQQQRLEQKLKGIQEFPEKMKAESGRNNTNIPIYKAQIEEKEQAAQALVQKIKLLEDNLNTAQQMRATNRPFDLDLKRLNSEKKDLEAILADEKTMSKEEPSARLKEVETAIERLHLQYAPTIEKEQEAWKNMKTALKRDFKELGTVRSAVRNFRKNLQDTEEEIQQIKKSLQQAIEDERAYKEISERSAKFAPGTDVKIPEVQGPEEGRRLETDLNERKLEQNKLENEWLNKLGERDPLYTFDKAKQALEKDLKIDQSKRMKKNIDLELLKENGAKAAVKEILEGAAVAENVISKYDSLSVSTASPEVSGLLVQYMKVAQQYNEMIGKAFGIYMKAEKKQVDTEWKDDGTD